MSLRISKSTSKGSTSYYIIKDIRKTDGRWSTKRVEKLGTLSSLMEKYDTDQSGVEAILQKRLEVLRSQQEIQTQEVVVRYSQSRLIRKNQETLVSGGHLFLQSIFHNLHLDRLCSQIRKNSGFEYNLSDILSTLVYMRILEPSSKKGTVEAGRKLLGQPELKLHSVYRALSVLSENSDLIQAFLYRKSLDVIDRNEGVLFYDCTNFFFEIEEEDDFRRYGKSKEHRPSPIVQMGLFMDGNGYPLAFSLFPGNESEQPSLKKLESKIIKDFRHSKMVVCTDAGLASASNRRFNSIGNRAFITTQSIKKLKSDIREWCLSPVGWKLLGSSSDKLYDISKVDESVHEGSIFYKESPYTDAQGTRQSLIVTYSIRYRRYCRVIRDGQISRAMRLIEKGQKKLKNNPNAPSRFIREESFNSETGEVSDGTSLSLDSEKIRSEAMYDGFYAVCTNLEDSVERVVDISRRRWEIEESFRILKSEFSARPVFLSRKDRITAHFLVCFIALLIYRILEHRLDEKYTVSEIVGTLRSMEFQHVPGEGYIPAYTRTDLTDSLHELFGFRTDHEITSEKNMKKIIKQTKAKNITRN